MPQRRPGRPLNPPPPPESRSLLQGLPIPAAPVPPGPDGLLPAGTLCVDNELYGRYQGEVEIVTVPRPADRRTNVLGHLGPEALPSLQAVGPGTSFRLLPEA